MIRLQMKEGENVWEGTSETKRRTGMGSSESLRGRETGIQQHTTSDENGGAE